MSVFDSENFKRSRERERERDSGVYVTVKFAVVPPTLGLRSCQGGVGRGTVQEETSLVGAWGRKGKGRGTN